MKIRNIGALIIDDIRANYIYKALAPFESKGFLLDLGCGEKPFKPLYESKVTKSVGIDVPFTRHNVTQIDSFALATELPFKSCVFDIVLCTEVMEHVAEPERLLSEVYRVLKPEGILVLTVPFLVPLHETPYDFYRYTKYGLEHLLNKTGLTIINIESFSEYFGVTISLLVQLQLKLWTILSKKMKLQFLKSPKNPFVFLFILLPQLLYLMIYNRKEQIGSISKILVKLSYTPKGYGLIARRGM